MTLPQSRGRGVDHPPEVKFVGPLPSPERVSQAIIDLLGEEKLIEIVERISKDSGADEAAGSATRFQNHTEPDVIFAFLGRMTAWAASRAGTSPCRLWARMPVALHVPTRIWQTRPS